MTSDGPGTPSSGDGPPAGDGRRPLTVQLGEQLLAVTRRLDDIARQNSQTAGQVAEIAGHVSEMAPRLDEAERSVAALGGAVEAAGIGGGGGSGEDDEALALTPALRWSGLAAGDRRAAWDALSGFVAEVLNGDYRLTRLELPDCWPVHPRAVRELAWLRTVYVSSSAAGVRPELVAEWHVRWLPAAITNLAVAIDPRECMPGKHRLTEEERRQYDDAVQEAETAGQARPQLTSERSADRPRYLPDQFPALRGPDMSYGTRPEGAQALDRETPPPASRPEHWWEYFLDARLADVGEPLSS